MAIIKCPQCGKEISDQSVQCVHCGYTLNGNHKHCKECGTELTGSESVCPNCGCPVDPTLVGQAPVKKKKHIVRYAVLALALVVVLFGMFEAYQYNKVEAYYQLVDEVHNARNASVDAVNECSALLLDVWKNAIWQTPDPTTDKYTCPDGVFSDDFNDALGNLYADADFCDKLDLIEKQQLELRKLKKQLTTPPKGMEDYNELLIDMIDNHVKISMIILNPTGSYDSISADFNDLFEEDNEIHMELESYNE